MPEFKTYRDETLVKAIAIRRDARAFTELYDRWSARIYRYFLRLMRRDAAKAEDMTQDLFIKIIEKSPFFDPERRFSTWLYTLAANMCKNEFRRKKIFESVAFYPEIPGLDASDSLPEFLDRVEMEKLIQLAIDQLDEPQRQCFVLRWQEEFSVRDISEIMNCPEGTVKSRLHYALRQVSDTVRIISAANKAI